MPNPTVKSGIKIGVASVGSIPPAAIAGDRSPISDRQSDRQRAMVQIAEGIEPPIRDSYRGLFSLSHRGTVS